MGNGQSSPVITKRPSISRTNSSNEIPTSLPVEKLAKILSQTSADEDSVQGITCRAFSRKLFLRYPELGLRVFGYLHWSSGSNAVDRMTTSQFKAQVEKLLTVMSDDTQTSLYVKMFAACNTEIGRENFRDLIMTGYRLAMDHYAEGPQTCLQIHKTINAVTNATLRQKDSVSVGFASHWLQEHCPRLVTGIHKYVVHVFTTAHSNSSLGLELNTPVLEKNVNFDSAGDDKQSLPLSLVWLLATSLPPLFTRPQQISPSTGGPLGPLLPSHQILVKMMGWVFPSHWLPLYNSNAHGLGWNRFLTHVLHYKGPTITIISSGDETFLIASGEEWRESHVYWGGPDCVLMQLNPEYHVIERGAKLMYLNGSIRGYPKGIRAGSDPKKPNLIVDSDFGRISYKQIPYPLHRVEVWGCGKPEQRDAQLEVKKWEVKQAEKQRVVKLNAQDWVDHPDRYLLELNGRTVYNT